MDAELKVDILLGVRVQFFTKNKTQRMEGMQTNI